MKRYYYADTYVCQTVTTSAGYIVTQFYFKIVDRKFNRVMGLAVNLDDALLITDTLNGEEK